MEHHLDFEGLNSVLLHRARELVVEFLPGGRVLGREYMCGDLRGGEGDSLRVNLQTGKWADFATQDKGGDLVSLYAAIQSIGQGEAARQLADRVGFNLQSPLPLTNGKARSDEEPVKLAPPPAGQPGPVMNHGTYGEPTKAWCYRWADGSILFYVARYDPPGKRKQFLPWSWSPTQGRWVQKAWPHPRPIYGLEVLSEHPSKPVLIVEGEKAADAARVISGKTYVVVTWPNGSQAWDKCDWAPLYGRKVLIWPDADKAGLKAARELSKFLVEHSAEVKLIDVSDVENDGWDAADALASEWKWREFREWAVPRAQIIEKPVLAVPVERIPNAQLDVTVSGPDEIQPDGSVFALWEKLGIATAKNGSPICNVDNALRVLENSENLVDLVWFDEFHQKYFTKWNTPDDIREWSEIDGLKLTAIFQRELQLTRMSDEMVRKAVMIYAHAHKRNEPKDWMEGLIWDQHPRIEAFFVECFGAEETEFVRAASKNWWISMAARIYSPGCQVDNMVILEGGQGKFKSTALNVIGGPWYTEAHENVTSKDFYMLMQGKLLLEISELDAFSRAEVNTIKKVITTKTDRFRPPYGHTSQDFPRRCVFVGTTNEESYLKDHTGGRRFWPIRINEIDVPMIKDLRNQLFAEATHRFKASENWYIMPTEETKQVQESRRQYDEWESIIGEYLLGKHEVTVKEVATAESCLDMNTEKLDQRVQSRITKILTILGWRSRVVKRGGHAVRRWVKDEEPADVMSESYNDQAPF